ncbi:MAG: hypothetical protein ACE14M_11195 [Terriglobales bacterium]
MKLLRSLFGVLVVVAVIYLGWLIGPAYLSNYQLEDSMDEIARMASVQQPPRSEEQIRNDVLKEAQALGISLDPERINITRIGGGVLGADVLIWADYSVHFDFPFYPFDIDFHPASKTKKRAGG